MRSKARQDWLRMREYFPCEESRLIGIPNEGSGADRLKCGVDDMDTDTPQELTGIPCKIPSPKQVHQ